jgi:hypothetical protein
MLRESKASNKVSCPAIDDELVGKAIEMGYQVERDLVLDQDAWVGSHVEKDFNGVMYCGIVTSFEDGLFYVEYDDGDEEDMDRGDLGTAASDAGRPHQHFFFGVLLLRRITIRLERLVRTTGS